MAAHDLITTPRDVTTTPGYVTTKLDDVITKLDDVTKIRWYRERVRAMHDLPCSVQQLTWTGNYCGVGNTQINLVDLYLK